MNLKKKVMFLLFSFTIGLLNPLAVFSATDPSALSPEAQAAFQKGMIAAEQGSIDLALKYFKETQKASPFYPSVLFNLGVALAKNGKELPAIAWLHAYLVSGATPEEKKLMEAELLKLEVGVEAKAMNIMNQAIDLAGALPEGELYSNPRKQALQQVYWSYVGTGNLEEAIKFGKDRGIITSETTQDTLMNLVSLVGEYADRGDITKAEKIAGRITEEPWQTEAWLKLSKHYAKVKDIKKLEMVRSKLKGPLKQYDLRDIVVALVDNGQMDLAKSYIELGDAEALAMIIFDMSLKGREEEVREFLRKAEEAIQGNDLNALTNVADSAVILKDFDMLKRLIPRIEEGDKVYSTPSIFRAHLAGYYAQLKNYKKADELLATFPPDDPNDFFKQDRSNAVNSMLKAALAQGDIKRFESDVPQSRSGFLLSELGEMFGKLAWQKISEGKEKDAEKIMASCPDGGAIAGWKSDDPNLHRDVMYHFLAYQAAKAGQVEKAYGFLGKVTVKGPWLAAGVGSIGDALIQNEDLDGAVEFFEKQKDKSRGMPLSLIELAVKKGRTEDARSWFKAAMEAAVKNNELYQADQMIALAEKLGLAEQAQELKHLRTINAWVTLADKLENDTTFDPVKTYEEAKTKPSGEVPWALARLSQDYWKRLREIDFLKRSQGT